MTTTARIHAQMSISDASAYLLGATMQYTTLPEYFDKYYRKMMQKELMARHNISSDVFCIILDNTKILREDAPPHPNLPFIRHHKLSEVWLDAAFDHATIRELQEHV